MNEPITQKQFADHCKENQITADQLDKLMPLVDLIPTLNEIVEGQKATVYMGRRILRWIGYLSAAIGLLYLIFKFWEDVSK